LSLFYFFWQVINFLTAIITKLKHYRMKNTQHNPLNDSELFRPLCRYFMLTKALFSVYLSINSEYYLFLID
ncbi:TPA: hypothetical protein ACNR37_000778, partial [Escherichia coli]